MARPYPPGNPSPRVPAPIKFEVGDKVKLSGVYLKSTGQERSSEGLKTWTITDIIGGHGGVGFAVVDEPVSKSTLDFFTPDELAADPTLRFRRINLRNLVKLGQVTSRNCT